MRLPPPPLHPEQESSIAFRVVLAGRSLLCRLFLVHDVPQLTEEAAGADGGASGTLYSW